MTNEQLRMQMLAGIITEGEYATAINQEVENTEKDEIVNFDDEVIQE
jgi:hypothetical protein